MLDEMVNLEESIKNNEDILEFLKFLCTSNLKTDALTVYVLVNNLKGEEFKPFKYITLDFLLRNAKEVDIEHVRVITRYLDLIIMH